VIGLHAIFAKPKSEDDFHQGIEKSLLEQKLREYNQYYENKYPKNIISCREKNGKMILEGRLHIYWDVSNQLILKEENDDRLVMRRRNSFTLRRRFRRKMMNENNSEFDTHDNDNGLDQNFNQSLKQSIQPLDNDNNQIKVFDHKVYTKGCLEDSTQCDSSKEADKKQDSALIDKNLKIVALNSESNGQEPTRKRNPIKRSQIKLRRRCSINGHFYNRETCVFTPDRGTVTSVWLTSLVNTTEVINQLLDKFKVTNKPQEFAMFIVRDNGECKRIGNSEYPLLAKLLLGPNEDAARVFILNKNRKEVSCEVAQYLNFSNVELQLFLKKFEEEEEKEIERVKERFESARKYIEVLLNKYQNV